MLAGYWLVIVLTVLDTYRIHGAGSRHRSPPGGWQSQPTRATPRCWVDTDRPYQWRQSSCRSKPGAAGTGCPACTLFPRRRQRSHQSHLWHSQKLGWCHPQCWRVLWRLKKEQFIIKKWFPSLPVPAHKPVFPETITASEANRRIAAIVFIVQIFWNKFNQISIKTSN